MKLSEMLSNVKFDVSEMAQPECQACKIDYGEDDDEKSLSGLLTEDD